jgi:cation diffusion facilitator CzcD-associated flavoprotein CzcO
VIGAGPYGLSVAAHLKAAKISTRAFGRTMSFWRENMPKGMKLRSTWGASHLSDPDRALTLDGYTAAHDLDIPAPTPLEDFVRYGEWFQSRAIPDLDTRKVVHVAYANKSFRLRLEDGEVVHAKRVVVATGLQHQDFRPEAFEGLPRELASHSADHVDLDVFRGKHVAVIGRGQSATESAALLHEAGADVELISRGDVHWLGSEVAGGERRHDLVWRLHKMLSAPSGVGPFPIGWLSEVPTLVHHFPAWLRERFSTRCLRAGATAWVRARFDGVRVNPGRTIVNARPAGGQVELELDNGSRRFDHALLATGYRIDISKLGFLAPKLLKNVRMDRGSPVLSMGCESTLNGLHFVGCSAVRSFGPLMRFVAGVGYAARSVTQAVLASRSGDQVDRVEALQREFVAGAAQSLPRL